MSETQNNPMAEVDLDDVILPSNASEAEPPSTVEEPIDELEQPPAAPQSAETEQGIQIKRTQPNVEEHFDTENHTHAGSPDTLNLPPEASDVVYDALTNSANVDIMSTDNQFRWKSVLRDGLSYLVKTDVFSKRLADENSKFSQVIEYNGHKLHSIIPTRRQKPGVTEMEGEMALLQVVTHLGIGGLAPAPMYNSGFWVRFKPATDSEMLELSIILASDKIRFGRESHGLTHSNHIVYSLDRVFTMALAHVYSTSVKAAEMPIEKIAEYLKPQDIHACIWGFLCSCYPNGFNYETSCVNNVANCQHVFKGKLNISKILVSDNNALTDKQKNHMLKTTTNSMSLKEVQDYQESVSLMHDRRIVIAQGTPNEIAITLKTPTIPEYIEQGMRYINGIVDGVTKSMAADAGSEERNHFVRTAANASLLCQYIHFVKSIEIGETSKADGSVVRIGDNDTIFKTLQTLSSVESIRTKIIEEILDYIGRSTISIVAIPAYECPSCGHDQSEGTGNRYPRHRSYVPVDIFQVFFGLFSQRMNRLSRA